MKIPAVAAGDDPPAPRDAEIDAAANVMRDAAFCPIHAAAWRGEATDATQWRVRAGALNCNECNTLALRCALGKFGAVPSTPRAALNEAAELVAKSDAQMLLSVDRVSRVEVERLQYDLANALRALLGAASPAPPEEP